MSCAQQAKIDLTKQPCIEICRALFNAYNRMLTGGQKTQVRHGEFVVEYRANSSSDMDRLKTQYEQMRAQCPEAMAELPSLTASNRRGFSMGRSECIPGGINPHRGRY